jgi:hypothetical protein
MRRSKSFAFAAILVLLALIAPPATVGQSRSNPRTSDTLLSSVGQQLTQPLAPLKSPGKSGLTLSEGHGWLPIDAAVLAHAKADAAAAAGRKNNFSISASPASRSVARGGVTSYTVSTAVTSGKAQTVRLSLAGLPAGATGSFNPSSVTAGGSSTLTITTGGTTPTGTFTLTVTGAGTTTTHSTTVSLIVTAPPPPNDFSISASPSSQTVVQGSGTSYSVVTAVTSGSAQTVNLAVTGLPASASGSFNPSSVTAGGSSTLSVTTGTATPAGTFTLTITGTGTSATNSATVGLTVTAPQSGGPTVGLSWNGQSQGGIAPPDPTGAIGPSSYIELINLRYGIYDRATQSAPGVPLLLDQGDLGQLTGFPVTELSDPQILWDSSSQRYYYLVLDVYRDTFAFGYSTGPSPTSSADFCRYIVDFGYGQSFSLPDYPKLGVTRDFVLVGSNVFNLFGQYSGSDVDWFIKPAAAQCPGALGAGGVFRGLRNTDGAFTSTPVPAVNADPTSTGWVVGSVDVGAGSGSMLTVFSVTRNASGGAVISAPTAIPVSPYSVPPAAPQPGTTATIDTLDTRLKHAVAGVDPALGTMAIWTTHTVFGGAGAEERWYEIGVGGPAAPALAQAGKASSASLYVFNGGISPDRANDGQTGAFGNNMVLGFNTSSPTDYPAVQMVSKQGASPQSGFALVRQSLGLNVDFSCTPTCRWGDYSGATPDPLASAGGQVWLSGEWNLAATDGSATVWQTWNWSAKP